jgi:ketosteroid isomerase-like protein
VHPRPVGLRETNSVGAMPDEVADEDHPGDTGDEAAVRLANHAFYEAFEARDMDAMSDVWEHDDRVSCTHPGWRTLHGWGAVSASWFALFRGPQPLQFILTNEQVAVAGEAAWVTVDENLISAEGSGTVAAVNVYVRREGRWRLVAHHGSAVAPQA